MSKPNANSDFLSHMEAAAPMISQHDRGPFRLIHPDFGHNNIIVDDEFNILGVIDWEESFIGPSEMVARFPIRCLVYPDAIYPLQWDSNGTILDKGRRERYEGQQRLVSAIKFHEDRLSVSTIVNKFFWPVGGYSVPNAHVGRRKALAIELSSRGQGRNWCNSASS